MKVETVLACAVALASLAVTSPAQANGGRWAVAPAAHAAVHAPAYQHRPAIPAPVFVPPVVMFNPFVPAFVTATPIVVYEGTLPPLSQPGVGASRVSVAAPNAAPAAAGPRTPGTGTWLVRQMPARVAAPAPRTHGGEPVLEIRRTPR
jgi:hypothetical protein